MSAIIMDGKKLRDGMLNDIKWLIDNNWPKNAAKPCLAVISVDSDPASEVYVRNKQKACEKAGVDFQHYHFKVEETSCHQLCTLVQRLNFNPTISGIIVQLPMPRELYPNQIIACISPQKDVDGFSEQSIAILAQGKEKAYWSPNAPCTPEGIMCLLREYGISLAYRNAVVIGRSNIVGKPMARMLLNEDATVTICHSKTKDLAQYTRNADIIVSAAGKPNLITADMVKPGAVVIDVGINRVNGKLCGDVDFEKVKEVAGYITPVPGGVGPMTVAMVVVHTYELARLLTNK